MGGIRGSAEVMDGLVGRLGAAATSPYCALGSASGGRAHATPLRASGWWQLCAVFAAAVTGVDQTPGVYAVNVPHETRFDDVVAEHVLNASAVVAGNLRRHSEYHIFDLSQARCAVLRSNCQSLAVGTIGATAM